MSDARRADRRRELDGYMLVSYRAGGRCELAFSPDCTGRHECTHHRLPRSASSVRNENRHDPELLLALCNCCHMAVHAEPTLSYEKGWLIRR